MTQPNPDQQPDQPPADPKPVKPKVKVGDVVSFTRTDPILRSEHRGVGVVVGVDDAGVDVRPVERRHLRLAGDEVSAITGEDVAG